MSSYKADYLCLLPGADLHVSRPAALLHVDVAQLDLARAPADVYGLISMFLHGLSQMAMSVSMSFYVYVLMYMALAMHISRSNTHTGYNDVSALLGVATELTCGQQSCLSPVQLKSSWLNAGAECIAAHGSARQSAITPGGPEPLAQVCLLPDPPRSQGQPPG